MSPRYIQRIICIMFYTQYATCSCKYLISYYMLLTTLEIFIYFLVLHLFIHLFLSITISFRESTSHFSIARKSFKKASHNVSSPVSIAQKIRSTDFSLAN